jgi:hypothetical protein
MKKGGRRFDGENRAFRICAYAGHAKAFVSPDSGNCRTLAHAKAGPGR